MDVSISEKSQSRKKCEKKNNKSVGKKIFTWLQVVSML